MTQMPVDVWQVKLARRRALVTELVTLERELLEAGVISRQAVAAMAVRHAPEPRYRAETVTGTRGLGEHVLRSPDL